MNATLTYDAHAYGTLTHQEAIFEDPRVRVGMFGARFQRERYVHLLSFFGQDPKLEAKFCKRRARVDGASETKHAHAWLGLKPELNFCYPRARVNDAHACGSAH